MPLKHINTNKFPANYLVGFRDLVFSWLNDFLNPIILEIASINYSKNKKSYTYFRYKILFPPVINSDLKNQTPEYQPTIFLRAKLLPCCFTVIPSVTLLFLSVIPQISFYIENKKVNMNKYVIDGLCELLGKTNSQSFAVTAGNCPLTTDYYCNAKFTGNCLILNYNLYQ